MNLTESGIWRPAYSNDPAIVYALDADLRLVRSNPAWDRFARENGAPELTGPSVLGAKIMDAIPAVLQDFYGNAYDLVRRFQRPWCHIFDCSSADLSRSFQMRVLPAAGNHLIVVNTLIREEPHQERIAYRIEEYTDAEGIVTMCANCRRAEHLTHPGRWDWLPLLLASTGTLVRPGLCAFCFAYYYRGKLAGSRPAPR